MLENYGVLITPFNEIGKIDFDEVERNIENLADKPIDGIVVNGSTSEFLFLDRPGSFELMKVVKNAAKNKYLIMGATSPELKTCCDFLDMAGDLDYDACLIAPPYYFKYTQDEIFNFYKEISKNYKNIYAYNVPFFTTEITLETYVKMLDLQNIIGFKNSGQNIKEISQQIQIKETQRPNFKVYSGTEDIIFPCLAVGADGSMTALGYLLPEIIGSIYKAFIDKNYTLAGKLQKSILPITRLCDSLTFPVGYKLLAQALGMKTYYKQTPFVSEEKMNEVLEKLKVLRDFKNELEKF